MNSHQLPCGCLLGVYETYDGLVVRLFDAISDTCSNPGHRPGTIVPAETASSAISADAETPPVQTRGAGR